MQNQEPSFFVWIKADVLRYWKIVAAIPIVYSLFFSVYNSLAFDIYSFWYVFVSVVGQLPETLVYLLFLKYLRFEEKPVNHQRLSVETTAQGSMTGSVNEFFKAAALRWVGGYLVTLIFSASFFLYSFIEGLIFVCSYALALRETRLVQKFDSHDGSSRILGTSVFFLCLISLSRLVYYLFFRYSEFLYVNPLYLLLSLSMIVLVLWYEQKRYMLAQAVYHAKDKSHVIEPLDPLRPPQGLLPLAYWPEVNFDGVLYRVERNGSKDDPFRSNEVKVPLYIVPLQPEPFLGLLSRRLYGFIGLLLLSVFFLLKYLSQF